jgi:hypothetical protein
MSTDKKECSQCEAQLCSKIEVKTNFCVLCLSKLSDENNTLKSENEKLKKYADEMHEIISVQKEGSTASERNIDIDDNPYDSDKQSKQNALWLSGWYSNELHKNYMMLLAIFEWSLQSLYVIDEIIANDGDDFKAKLGTVIIKMQENIDKFRSA